MIGRVKQRGGDCALFWIALAAMSGLICFPEPARAAEDADARKLVGAALRAMSGQEKFEVIHSAAFKGIERVTCSNSPNGRRVSGFSTTLRSVSCAT